MSVFDKDKDGTVNCAEFLLQFCLLGSQVRGAGQCRRLLTALVFGDKLLAISVGYCSQAVKKRG